MWHIHTIQYHSTIKKECDLEAGEIAWWEQARTRVQIPSTHVKIRVELATSYTACNLSSDGVKTGLLTARQPSSRFSERCCLKRINQSDRVGHYPCVYGHRHLYPHSFAHSTYIQTCK